MWKGYSAIVIRLEDRQSSSTAAVEAVRSTLAGKVLFDSSDGEITRYRNVSLLR